MDPKTRRQHLHASVSAATIYGLLVGLWIGFRMGHAGWLEGMAFAGLLMFAPVVVMSRIDAKYRYTD